MSLQDIIVKDSAKQFRLRIDGYLRTIGVFQIIGTKAYIEIEFINGHSVIVPYPDNLEKLHDAIESGLLLLETPSSQRQIDNIRFYVNEYIEEIEMTLERMYKKIK
jgi:hypothetical protein